MRAGIDRCATFGAIAAFAVLAFLVVGLTACGSVAELTSSPTSQGPRVIVITATPRPTSAVDSPSPTPDPSATPEPIVVPSPTSLPGATPTLPSTPASANASDIVVVEPTSGQLVTSPIRVQGMARAYEATILVDVVVGGKEIASTPVQTSAGAPEWGVFDATIEADVPAGVNPVDATVRVMLPSMKDNTYYEVVSIPVRIQPSNTNNPAPGTRVVKVYFEKTVDNQMFFVAVNRTIPWTLAVGRASLLELIKGPTDSEMAAGLQTTIPAGTKVLGLQIKDGVAYADFDRTLQQGAQGSAAIYGMTQQIRLTLMQYSTVKSVVISVEGKTEGILEP